MKLITVCGLAVALSLPALAQDRLKWWTDARFGMFIHWGIYTVPAGEWKGKPIAGLGEWIMNRAKIPIAEYEQLAAQFNPVDFDADKWVAVAKNAGMKYITITAKHHDGFAMFGSKVSKYNIVDATPFHRDPMKELSAACQRAGLKLCFYYSQTQDWHEPDGVGNDWDFPSGPRDFQKYFDEKVIPQVRELLTNYGPIGLIWFDTPRNITREQSQRLADLVHQLQPACLVSGRVGNGLGDYDSAGDNQISMGGAKRPWETPVTLNDTWGFKKDDHNWKSSQVLIRQLATTASRGGNYLLNVGPTSRGVIPPESVERLAEVGKWMHANGESIYATSGSPYPYDVSWGVLTSKPGRLYLHVFHWPGKELVMYGLTSKVQSASLLATGVAVKFTQKDDPKAGYTALTLSLPDTAPDPNDSVIVLDVPGKVTVDPSLEQQPDGVITLPPLLAGMHKAPGSEMRLDSRGVTERWTRADDWLDWNFKVNHPGEFEVELITSQQKYGNGWDGGQRVKLQIGGKEVAGVVADNGQEVNPANPYWPYIVTKLGRIKLDKAGSYSLAFKPESIPDGQKYGLTLVDIRMVPAAAAKPAGQEAFSHWPAGASPTEIGERVAEHFVSSPHARPTTIIYPETCAWYGALNFAVQSGDKDLSRRLVERFDPILTEEGAKLIPRGHNVDSSVFGAVPLELAIETKDRRYLQLGQGIADRQWETLTPEGLTTETRFWIDDMFMITALQVQAYRATGDAKYIDRAALEMTTYLDKLQQPNGLFYHAPDVPIFWGRGDGWVAAGMAEVLRTIPADHPRRAQILAAFRKMMASLLTYQGPDGTWRQIIDHPESWTETSSTGMFTFAMITGVKNGWLDEKTYGPAARKGWLGLVSYIDANSELREVCEGTNKKIDVQYYLDRKRNTGDLHGQAPILWCAAALLRT